MSSDFRIVSGGSQKYAIHRGAYVIQEFSKKNEYDIMKI
jgi:hypothetical protein